MSGSFSPLIASLEQAGPVGQSADAAVEWLLNHGQGLFGVVQQGIQALASALGWGLALPAPGCLPWGLPLRDGAWSVVALPSSACWV